MKSFATAGEAPGLPRRCPSSSEVTTILTQGGNLFNLDTDVPDWKIFIDNQGTRTRMDKDFHGQIIYVRLAAEL